MECSDRVTVLRDGRVMEVVDTKTTNTRELARMMVGREVLFKIDRPEVSPGREILRVENLEAQNMRHLPALKGLSLGVRAGEVVGIAGVDGNGQTELVEVLTGLRKTTAGKIFIDGKEMIHGSTGDFLEAGTAHIPEDRLLRGLVLDFPLYENLMMGFQDKKPFAKGPFLDFKYARKWAETLVEKYDVRTPGVNVMAGTLSGGTSRRRSSPGSFSGSRKSSSPPSPPGGWTWGPSNSSTGVS